MTHLMFCVSGFSGVGKDEFCNRLVSNHSAVHIGLADPAKRHMAELYEFSRDQLFGPSIMRNAGDMRYVKPEFKSYGFESYRPGDGPSMNPVCTAFGSYCPSWTKWSLRQPLKMKFSTRRDEDATMFEPMPGEPGYFMVEKGDPRVWLSPREALQQHCERMNDLYEGTWAHKAVENHKKLSVPVSRNGTRVTGYQYDKMAGLVLTVFSSGTYPESTITCLSDFRHVHELKFFRNASSASTRPILVRMLSDRVPSPPYDHRSETEQVSIPDNEFDYVVTNNGSVAQLHETVDMIVESEKKPTGTRFIDIDPSGIRYR